MPVTLTRKPFTKEERDIVVEAVMTGSYAEDWPELDDIATQIAEKLPDLLKHAKLVDSSHNRRTLIEFVLLRWAAPKTPPRSRAYRRLAR